MEPISSLSREFLFIPVQGATGGEAVEVAFVNPSAEPAEGDWHTAAWDSTTEDGATAKILVGPGEGAVTLADGTYRAWVRVTSAEERPVLSSGLVPIT